MPESAKEGDSVLPEGSDIGLGCRGRAFESRHSDQTPLKSADFRGVLLIPCLLRRKWREFWELNLVVQLFDDKHPWVCYN